MANAPQRCRPDGAGGVFLGSGATKIPLLRSGFDAADKTTNSRAGSVVSRQTHHRPGHGGAFGRAPLPWCSTRDAASGHRHGGVSWSFRRGERAGASAVRRGIVVEDRGPTGGKLRSGAASGTAASSPCRPEGAGGVLLGSRATKIPLLRSGMVHVAGKTTKVGRGSVASRQTHHWPCHGKASAVRRDIVVEARGPTGGKLRSGAAFPGAKRFHQTRRRTWPRPGFSKGPGVGRGPRRRPNQSRSSTKGESSGFT